MILSIAPGYDTTHFFPSAHLNSMFSGKVPGKIHLGTEREHALRVNTIPKCLAPSSSLGSPDAVRVQLKGASNLLNNLAGHRDDIGTR